VIPRAEAVDQFLGPALVMVAKAARRAHADAVMGLVRTQTELGLTFCQLMRTAGKPAHRERDLALAAKALESAQRQLWTQVGHVEFANAAARVDRLARAIAALAQQERTSGRKLDKAIPHIAKVMLFRVGKLTPNTGGVIRRSGARRKVS
jgi:hypothetical protein